MKKLHSDDWYGWSLFDESRNIDFHGTLWRRDSGNVVIDPLPMTPHDRSHVAELGGASWIVVTNSDHLRDAAGLAKRLGAKVAGPAAEQGTFPIRCDAWWADGDEPFEGLSVIEVTGSKTPGELALLCDRTTLVTGDLVRAHEGGRLTILPEAKLRDRAAAAQSVRRLAEIESIETVLVGDGWPIFRGGSAALRALVDELG